jgi:hypothetical protein
MAVRKKISGRIIFKRVRAVFILATAGFIGLRGCSAVDESLAKIVLHNESKSTINFMQVKVNDKTFEVENILPGQEHTLKFKPSSENALIVNGRLAAGVDIQASTSGYMASANNKEHYLTIQGDGRVSYSSPK